jgi:dephospho-CoA kinase
MVRVLLGGGIGSGKSAAGALFSLLGASVLSADRAAHRVLEPGGAAEAAVAARWPSVVAGGRIDRARLAEIVFTRAEALAELESFTHPAIGRLLAEEVAAASTRVVMVEMPLPVDLLGPGWRWVVVDAADETRLDRLVARGLSREEADRRMAAQPSRDEWLARADVVVDNSGDWARLEAECRRAWQVIGEWAGEGVAG